MKPITWLRKLAARGFQGYPMATLAFYGPDVDEVNQFCQEKGIPNDSKARAQLAAHKAQSGSR